jgi:indolepyruvate ferredoxin oxidoreductase, beta subunit
MVGSMRPYNLLITGVGGQGTVVASDILAAVGLAAGYDVKKSDVLGLAVRGGSVISHVRWGEDVRSPVVPEGRADILLAFEYLEALRWLDQIRPDGAILVNHQRIFPVVVSAGRAEYPTLEAARRSLQDAARDVYVVPGVDIAGELGNTRTLNVVLLGALSGLLDIDEEIWREVIRKRVPAKVVDTNMIAFQRGRDVLGESRLAGAQAAEELVR